MSNCWTFCPHIARTQALCYTVSMDNLIVLLAVIAGYFMGNAHARQQAITKTNEAIDALTQRHRIKAFHKYEPKSIDDERADQIADKINGKPL